MVIDAYSFPLYSQSIFIYGDQKISGQHWAKECLVLAQEINSYSESNWLLYQDDFYQYSLYFFALLLAGKNIILAQSDQFERFKQAATLADISIGSINTESEQGESLLPHFSSDIGENQNNEKTALPSNALSIDANISITLFTSGSTGESKAITKYWYQLANEIESLERLFSYENSSVLSTVTHKHIYGLLFKLIWPVFTHKQIICETIEYPEQVEHYCQTFNNIVLVSSPSYLTRTSKQFSTQTLSRIQGIFCSGGALSKNIAHEYKTLNRQVITEIYGSTETGGIAWRKQTKNVQWQLFPEHQVTLAQDETLELKSNFLPKGEIYKTDDRVNLNGRFFNLLGRVDRIIKLHEKRLSLDEMEAELANLANIRASHCFVLNKPKSKAALVAVVELETSYLVPNDVTQKKHLVNECKKSLLTVFEPSLLPRKWRFVKQLPFNSQGKLVKTELVNLFI